ncbi:MAG: hypothetical protein IKW60_02845 [Clostridia bacterium]|nr:hypothetical protein [Clostridia bacterium]
MDFSKILGNESAKSLLTHTLNENRVGHAYIIEGGKGMGKMTLAKAFAAAILDTENPDTHPDFAVITNQRYDASKKQDTISVETVRSMRKDVYVRPYMGEKKVYVIPGADSMQAPAQNSLLKVFEEPPGYCTILLLAENANSFLPTILSRAMILRMQPVSQDEIAGYLERERGLNRKDADRISVMSSGSIGKALELLEDTDATALREETFQKMFGLTDSNHRNLYDFVNFLKQARGQCDFVLEVLLSLSRDMMVVKLGAGTVVNTDQEETIRKFCEKIPKQSATRFGEITMKYQRMIAQNVNYPIAVLCMATEYWEEIHDRNHRS